MSQVLRELLIADTLHTLIWWRYFTGNESLASLLVTATCPRGLQSALFTDTSAM